VMAAASARVLKQGHDAIFYLHPCG
jgi:hypothetical protein